jgi:hypothetical protein
MDAVARRVCIGEKALVGFPPCPARDLTLRRACKSQISTALVAVEIEQYLPFEEIERLNLEVEPLFIGGTNIIDSSLCFGMSRVVTVPI